MDTWIFFKWAFKSAAAVLIVTNTWTIVMGVFDAAQSVVASASGLIIGDTSINISSVMVGIEDRLNCFCDFGERGADQEVGLAQQLYLVLGFEEYHPDSINRRQPVQNVNVHVQN